MRKFAAVVVTAFMLIVTAGCTDGGGSTGGVAADGELMVHYLDVGQADCILITTASNEAMLIDAGNNADGEGIVQYLWDQGVEDLRYVIGTHPHEDHIGGLDDVIREVAANGTPFLGICLGLQLLFESSEETPGVEGLGILKGKVLRIPDKEGLKIPHIGWNSLKLSNNGRLFQGMTGEPYVYFVHSYYLQAEDPQIVKAVTDYSTTIHASVEKDNVFACQFHPEKSSKYGLKILENFAKLEKEGI